MFEDFANVWTPVLFSKELRDKPVGITLAGERLVLFRAKEGPRALLDRCPHRGVALSLGQVEGGQLVCPFHGWKFDGEGGCAHVPYNPRARRELLGVATFPTREVGGMIWVFTGAEPSGEPALPEALLDPAAVRWEHAEEWACHWTRAIENMLDFPHLPFVHWNTIGAGMRRELHTQQQMRLDTETTPTGFRLVGEIEGEPVSNLQFREPNGMELVIFDSPRGSQRAHVWCVPTSRDRTRMILCNTRTWGTWFPPLRLVDQLNGLIVSQDRAVCESHQPSEVPAPAAERSVATDKPTLRFRSWYLRVLKSSAAAPPAGAAA